MKAYKNLLKSVYEYGVLCNPARENMPNTKFLHSTQMKFDFDCGFPILTGKQMPFYSIVAELVGFMKGVTDVREFDRLGTSVWWDNAYKWNIQEKDRGSYPINYYKSDKYGNTPYSYDLGRIYSAQWRKWRGCTLTETYGEKDQLVDLINSINTSPQSRYHVMTAWNPIEMNNEQVSQPNCHVYFQASCTPIKKLSITNLKNILSQYLSDDTIKQLLESGYNPDKTLYTHLTQRSCDMFLGVPFNITSYSLFSILLAIFTNSLPIEFSWVGVNTHIYSNHFEAVEKYISNELYKRPKLGIKNIFSLEDIEQLETLEDVKKCFWLENYVYKDKIKAELSVGL